MIHVPLRVRLTRRKRCRDGFYLVINGTRIRHKARQLAMDSLYAWLRLQKVEIVTVREFVDRNRRKIAARMPREARK